MRRGLLKRIISVPRVATAVTVGLSVMFVIVNRPLTAPLPGTVHIADMTWVEIRSALEQGFTTVIVPSGGIEQNGPHMIVGKHDYIVKHAAERIAETLGKTLVAPVISYVPEGAYDPPTGHMRFPGTIGVTEQVYAGIVEGIARSLKAGGFRTIYFIADHGGSQAPQAQTIARLNAEWAGKGVRVIHGDAYYSDAVQIERLLQQGETRAAIGQHASIIDTSELMAINPKGVDLGRLGGARLTLQATGINGDPARASAERGRELLDMRIRAAVAQVRSEMAAP
jgi:creatinine amidohydrolase/Fe(II)-dependent formamide hydrolase-like protein